MAVAMCGFGGLGGATAVVIASTAQSASASTTTCPSGSVYSEGTCKCPPGNVYSEGTCKCPGGSVYSEGTCQCPPGSVYSEGTCTTTTTTTTTTTPPPHHKKHHKKPKKHHKKHHKKPKPKPKHHKKPKKQPIRTWINGHPAQHGSYVVAVGGHYTLTEQSRLRPYYIYAAPVGTKPSGGHIPLHYVGKVDGASRWRIQFVIDPAMAYRFHNWNIGVEIGGHLYVIHLHIS